MNFKTKHYQALMIGCGKMGGALLRQWIRSEAVHYTVVDPTLPELPNGVVGYDNADALKSKKFDIIIIAIKPQMVETILPDYANLLSEDGFVISMAAGCSAERLQTALKTRAIIRIMPNLPSFIGKGVAGLYASPECSEAQKAVSLDMMELAGTAVKVDSEDGLDRITAIAGSGPGYVFEFARTYVEAAESLGFSREQARALVLGTIVGTIEMAMDSDDDLETLRNNVTSKKGTTEAGLKALNADMGLSQKLKQTVDAAYNRAIELR
ncbi:pyrroline-5-carboxylate reductase [Litorimonas taeanensis]|uniref:Pyrroline-5-carboxylate reductase n=1 Tax=Litorimonas taeanensis TaxID=568099 RepID=A0A420WEG9_9PROT|nr:pyrroline-5-carboxylate reductase [Litorimonas taeanensis]RKQ69403.1 pyrroline-5-carboxylate reductase [Litorimonas taeanensis]